MEGGRRFGENGQIDKYYAVKSGLCYLRERKINLKIVILWGGVKFKKKWGEGNVNFSNGEEVIKILD
jgi:hypothetical protein